MAEIRSEFFYHILKTTDLALGLSLFPNPWNSVPWVLLSAQSGWQLCSLSCACHPWASLSPCCHGLVSPVVSPLSCPHCWCSGTQLWQGTPSPDTSGFLGSDCLGSKGQFVPPAVSPAPADIPEIFLQGKGQCACTEGHSPKSCYSHTNSFLRESTWKEFGTPVVTVAVWKLTHLFTLTW